MAYLLNYNFQIQSNRNSQNGNTHGVYNPYNPYHAQQQQQKSPPKVLSHFDDSYPLETNTIRRTNNFKDDEEYKYGRPSLAIDQEEQLIFAFDDI